MLSAWKSGDLEARLRAEAVAARIDAPAGLRARTLSALREPLPGARGGAGARVGAAAALALGVVLVAGTAVLLVGPRRTRVTTPQPGAVSSGGPTAGLSREAQRLQRALPELDLLGGSAEAMLVAEARLLVQDTRGAGERFLDQLPLPRRGEAP